MKAKDLMTPNPAVCQESDPIHRAVELMSRRNIGIVPIVDNQNRCCGVVTDRDICLDVILKKLDPATLPIGEIMHTNLVTCPPDEDVTQVINKMKQRQVKRVLVTEKGYCVGIVSEHDLALHYQDTHALGELSASVYR